MGDSTNVKENYKNRARGVVHGGEGAVKAIQRGEELSGLAADELKTVEAIYQFAGRRAIVTDNAMRTQAAANLYWNAIQKAAQTGDIDKLDGYVARFGWLVGVVTRLWQAEAAEEKAAEAAGVGVVDVLKAIKPSKPEGGEDESEV